MKRSIVVLALVSCVSPLYAAVTGTVMTPEGQPLAGARVSLTSVETVEARRTRLLSATPDPVALSSTQTDSKGNFTLESPKEPTVDLRIALRGYEPQQRRIERDEDTGAIVLQKVELKTGTVKANGKAIPNATVVLGYNNAEYLTKTDAQGKYEAPDPKRARVIAALHPDFAVAEETANTMSGNISTLDRTLSTPTPLTGRVVREDGTTPVAKAKIVVDGWPLATSGDDGAFTVTRANAKWTTVVAQTSTLVGTRAQMSGPLTIRAAKAATVTGRVLDSKTKVPVVGAVVRANTRGGGMRMVDTAWWGTITDAKGNYTLNTAPGTYSISIAHPAYTLNNGDVNLVSGQSISKEFVITPLARVSGMVLNDERKPVVAAAIATQDVREGMDMPLRAMQIFAAPAVSGPDGRFSARVRVDSEIKLKATKKGFPPATSDSMKLAAGERRTNIVLSMPSGIAVTGKITDRDGNPLSGVAVTSQPTPTGQRGMMQRMIMGGFNFGGDDDAVKTASDGTYAIRVTEGSHDFTFRREGFSTKNTRGKSIALGNENVIDASLDPSVEISGRVTRGGVGVAGVNMLSLAFGEGDTTDTITGSDGSFTLRGLSPGSTRVMLRKEEEMVNDQRSLTAPARDVLIELPAGTTVSGRVVDKSTHKPITAFQVGVSTSRSGGGMVMMAPPMLRSMTSDDGTFTIENVPVGAINFVASAPGYSTARLNLNAEEGKPIRNLDVELDTGVKLVGKITGPDGTPLSDASVNIGMMGPGMNISRMTDKRTVTNSSGEYEIEALEPGEETVSVSHAKYLPERKNVELKGREVRLDVQLSAGNRVSGMVVTESGAPVPEADVEAMTAGGASRRGKADASGRFEFDSLSPARYQFTASRNGYADGVVKDFDVATGAQVRIVMKSGGIITGFVRGLAESELVSTTVEARGTDGNAVSSVDSTGAYKLDGVPSGTVTVRATMMGRGFGTRKTSPSQTVEMSSGGSRQVDIEFRNDTVIKGHVRRNSQALGGAIVTFFPKPGSSQQTQSTVTADDQGNYSASGLDDGEYSVIVNDAQRFSSYTTTYNVHGSATFDIDHTAQPLRGRVVDSTSGDPIAEAKIQLRATGAGVSLRFADRLAATDTNGTFNLDLIPAGTYTLTASKQGFGNDVRDITVTDSSTMDDIELRLHKEEGMTLKIVDKRDGRALSGNFVVFDQQGRVMPDQRTFFPGMGGGESTDEIPVSLAPGDYKATISAMGYGTQHVSLRAPGKQTVFLAPAARIVVHSKHSDPRLRVRLIDANGIPYPRWTAQPSSTGLLPSPGATNLDSVAGGTYTLQLLGTNGVVMDSKQVTVGDGQTVDVEI